MKSDSLRIDLGVSGTGMVLDTAGVDKSTTTGLDFLKDRSRGLLFVDDLIGVTKLMLSITLGVDT